MKNKFCTTGDLYIHMDYFHSHASDSVTMFPLASIKYIHCEITPSPHSTNKYIHAIKYSINVLANFAQFNQLHLSPGLNVAVFNVESRSGPDQQIHSQSVVSYIFDKRVEISAGLQLQ